MPSASGRPIQPQYLTRLVSELATEDAIFTADVGTTTVWAARYLKMNGKRRLLGSFNHGSMANAMPQALGAQGAFAGRQVISLSGDGGFTMLMGDFISLVQLGLPVKVIVYNNATLGSGFQTEASFTMRHKIFNRLAGTRGAVCWKTTSFSSAFSVVMMIRSATTTSVH